MRIIFVLDPIIKSHDKNIVHKTSFNFQYHLTCKMVNTSIGLVDLLHVLIENVSRKRHLRYIFVE